MKHFIYTYTRSKSPGDGSGATHRADVYSIKRNQVTHLGEAVGKFTGETQLVVDFLILKGHLPKVSTSNTWALKEAGIATITRV